MGAARVHFPRLQRRASGGRAPLSLSPAAVAIRELLAQRCERLAELEPRALDLAAQVLDRLHEAICGRMTELRGTGSPEHRRRQLLGRDGLPVESLAYLALHAPDAVAAALNCLAAEIGYRLDPLEPDESASVAVELAHLVRASSDVIAGLATRLEDGLTPEEALEADAMVHDLKTQIAGLEASIHAVAIGERTR